MARTAKPMGLVTTFTKQLKLALQELDDLEKLGATSPLAAPYFLGAALPATQNGASAADRGAVLRRELHSAALRLWGETPPRHRDEFLAALATVRQSPGSTRYAYAVLELRVFQSLLKPRKLADIWERADLLPGSRTEHYRDFDEAVAQLGSALLQQLRPTFRLEQPAVVEQLVGYQQNQAACFQALQQGKTVILTGSGGMGKSTLAATLVTTFAQAGATAATFWYTIRPTLNDQLASLLFSLGYFLHQLGASQLWSLLVAGGDAAKDPHLATGLAQADLAQLQERGIRPLLCIDELDVLLPRDAEPAAEAHMQLLAFLDSLRRRVALLFVSQRPVLDGDLYQELTGLPPFQIGELLQRAAITATSAEVEQLYAYTQGNPRLLVLCLALHEPAETIGETLLRLPQATALQPLLHRLWPRLTTGERRLLQQLSVFRTVAPDDGWQDDELHLQSLRQRRLLSHDGRGGVQLLPALRTLIYNQLSPDLKQTLHQQAAAIRQLRGEYTAAAYHYSQAGEEAAAITLWYTQRASEVRRGQASAAMNIFRDMRTQHLTAPLRQALLEIRSELRLLNGEIASGLAELEAQDWGKVSESGVRLHALQGDFLETLGYPDAAVTTYQAGINVATRLLNQIVALHRRQGTVQIRQRELTQAWRAARLAQLETHHLVGVLHKEEGRYTDAYLAYQSALALAESLHHDEGLARTHRHLANLCSRQQKFTEAINHAQAALHYYEQIGDRLNEEIMRSTLSAIYIDSGNFQEAIAPAQRALPFLKSIKATHVAANTAVNLAEAYCALGDCANATRYAQEVLDQEERHAYPYALYTMGKVKRAEGNDSAAQTYFHNAATVAHSNGDCFMEAYAWHALGLLHLMHQQIAEGHTALRTALRLFEQLQINPPERTDAEHRLRQVAGEMAATKI